MDGIRMFFADKLDSVLGVCDYQVGILRYKFCQEPFENPVLLGVWLLVVQYPDDFSSTQFNDEEEDDGDDGLQ